MFCKGQAECGGANLVAAPSNCTGVSTCNCAPDSFSAAWKTSNTANTGYFTTANPYVGYRNINGGAAQTEDSYVASSEYPAAKFCADLKINGFDDWYLPSQAELCAMIRSGNYCSSLTASNVCQAGNAQTADYRPLNSCSNAAPFVTGLGGPGYWSSNEFNALNAVAQQPVQGYVGNSNKTSSGYVRCVRRF